MSVRKISDSLMIECIMRHCLQILKNLRAWIKIRLFKRIKRRLVFKNMWEITHNIVILINFIFLLGNSLKTDNIMLISFVVAKLLSFWNIFQALDLEKEFWALNNILAYIRQFFFMSSAAPKYVATSKKRERKPFAKFAYINIHMCFHVYVYLLFTHKYINNI